MLLRNLFKYLSPKYWRLRRDEVAYSGLHERWCAMNRTQGELFGTAGDYDGEQHWLYKLDETRKKLSSM